MYLCSWNPICKPGSGGVCNLHICEVETGGVKNLGQPGLYKEFKASSFHNKRLRDYLKYQGLGLAQRYSACLGGLGLWDPP